MRDFEAVNLNAESPDFADEEMRELTEEEVLFLQVTGGAKGIGGGPIFNNGG